MGTYSLATFLAPYLPTDVILKFVNVNAQRTFGINVCQYEKASAEDNELWINLEDSKHRVLTFSTTQEAQQALIAFKNAVEILLPNCTNAPLVAPPQTINAITLIAYKAAQLANTLIPLQWYDISDTGPIYDLGPVIRAQAKTSSDYEPSGLSLTTNELVTLNVLDNTIPRRENTVNKTLAETTSFITIDDSSFYVNAVNFSTVNAANSLYVKAENNSILTVDTCQNVAAINGSDLVLVGGNNVSVDGIIVDLTAYATLVNDIQANLTDSIGKLGRENMVFVDNETLLSYINLVEQVTPIITSSIVKTLDNIIPTANAEFRILVGSGLGAYTITIYDTAATPLIVLSSGMANRVVTFRWNKNTNLFELVVNAESLNVVTLVVGVDGQTSIAGISPVPINPTTSTLEINGSPQEYGALNDYYIIGDTLFWTDNDFTLETTDELILKYT
jgi:hypothetical protein